MKRREVTSSLSIALEAAVAEIRRLEERNRQLEELLLIEEQVKYENDNYKPPRGRRSKKPKFKREEPEPQHVIIEPVSRRGVNEIYKEQKAKYENRVAQQLAEQEKFESELTAEYQRNDKPVDVKISEAKQKLLVEAGKSIMGNTGK